MKNKLWFLIGLILMMAGCQDLIDPAIENIQGRDDMLERPRLAQGLLINAYLRIPTNGWSFSEMATDDAVSNDPNHAFLTMATGQWASNNNPVNQWTGAQSAIQYLNVMLEDVDSVDFAVDPIVNEMFVDRLKGESYGLRALFMYYLLQAHGGMADGQLLGLPILTESQDVESEFNIPRNSFEECMTQLYADAEQALSLLPLDMGNITDPSLIPSKYGDAETGQYNRVFGDDAFQLVSGRIVRAVMAQAALLAASPAFNPSGDLEKWKTAAEHSASILNTIGGVSGLAPNGVTWFSNASELNAIGGGINPAEILWRTSIGQSNNLEADNFPPTLFGDGLINPTQNFVDAFPMANGYPIAEAGSEYNPQSPYSQRDPRLEQFVVLNGSTAGPSNSTIITAVDGISNDALNKVETSTRTGYYLRKLLRQDVNLNPNSTNSQVHVKPRIRYTEIFLIYAEAANEAYGPMGTGTAGFSAYDVVKAIRQRAGIGLDNGDAYLESIKGNQDAMRQLIRNERRLELSFEGFRFWDLRRWDADLTETAQGITIENDTHEVMDVENRVYSDYMIYGPVPYSETLKFSELKQNSGW
ncbi:RagB/SusD family nutrient uptake outer membrane protein [Algoriphagus sp. D3-2-R+10]|uniref:RagB/SusD family nutrient uptake outer membrane protein n=1 Tax=Algoriphagus aurantiacus TaxID=3103948 RepID=UPI002B3B4479|nr:RagB/SusD family nutrient uptake outer membrane protein [Algoriphagus sp. D3-2-R+10]MEB2775346.1 RagB/SusD family nutrient uptake outer membrane protein [Algoriphagus sp. D3-2-R+10]